MVMSRHGVKIPRRAIIWFCPMLPSKVVPYNAKSLKKTDIIKLITHIIIFGNLYLALVSHQKCAVYALCI